MARLTIAKAYERTNEAWPDIVPAMTADEAIRAGKRLYRWAMGETWTGPVVVTSGNRYSTVEWRRDGSGTLARCLVVNPEEGWKRFVHVLSHRFYYMANPGEKPHSKHHARIERRMIEQVIRRGWLQGKLKRTKREQHEPTKMDKVEARLVSIDKRIEGWESKAKRAASALQRLHDERKKIMRALEKQLAQAEATSDAIAQAIGE